jgi:hypothetical protein
MSLAEFHNLVWLQSVGFTRAEAEKLMVGRGCPRWAVRSEMDMMGYPVGVPGRKVELKETRRCACCKEAKPLIEFPRDASQSAGYGYVCLVCNKLKCKEKRENVKTEKDTN